MNTEQKPEAIRLADNITASGQFTNLHSLDAAASELRRQAARIQELERQLEAVGAGGVSTQRITHGAPAQKCTCPSGDGSLRWPCPAHPPSARASIAAAKEEQ